MVSSLFCIHIMSLFLEPCVSVKPLIDSGALGNCEVKFLRHGTYDDYREVLRARGANLNQVKPIKVIDSEDR